MFSTKHVSNLFNGISNTKDRVWAHFQTTRRMEYSWLSDVWKCDQTLPWVFDIPSQSSLKLRGKRRNKTVKIYAIQTTSRWWENARKSKVSEVNWGYRLPKEVFHLSMIVKFTTDCLWLYSPVSRKKKQSGRQILAQKKALNNASHIASLVWRICRLKRK